MTTKQPTQATRLTALESGQQTILESLAALTSVITGLQVNMATNGGPSVEALCWHGSNIATCLVCDKLKDMFKRYDVVPNDFSGFMSELAGMMQGSYDVEYLAEQEQEQEQEQERALDIVPKVKTIVSQSLDAVLDATAKHITANRKNKTFEVNAKILAASGPSDVRIYLTSAQHRTFRTAWKTAGVTLAVAKQALAERCGPNPN